MTDDKCRTSTRDKAAQSFVICHLLFVIPPSFGRGGAQLVGKSASTLKRIETSPPDFLSIETKTGNWRKDSKGPSMKITHLALARKFAGCTLACSAVPLSFLAGYCIRSVVIVGIGLAIRHWHSYLTLLSC
jgi:hypothetical protein